MAAPELSDEDKFNRVLYVTNLENRYTSGDPVRYNKRFNDEDTMAFLNEVFENKIEVLIAKAHVAGLDPYFPRRSHIFYILAKALHAPKVESVHKDKLSKLANEVARTDNEFFDFIQYCANERKGAGKRSLSHSVIRAAKRFYVNKSESELVDSYIKAHRYYSWSHKDLFKLTHICPSTPLKDAIIKYIMFKKTTEFEDKKEKDLFDMLIDAQTLRCATEDTEELMLQPIILGLKCGIKQICPALYKYERIWLVAIYNMTLQENLACLPRLYRAGHLTPDSCVIKELIDLFTNAQGVKASNIHPLEVFIHWKNFEKGGRPIDPKLIDYLRNEKGKTEEQLKRIMWKKEVKCPKLFEALQKCMTLACGNMMVTHKRYMVTIDTSDMMRNQGCVTTKTVTCLEAAVAYVHVLLNVEKEVTVAVFHDNTLKILDLAKKKSFAEHYKVIAGYKSTYAQYNSPMEWSMNRKNNFDIFVNFCHHMCLSAMPKELRDKMASSPVDVLVKYRSKKNLPNAKLVFWCPSSVRFYPAHGNHWGVLNAAGFDGSLCRAVGSFCRGMWS